MTLRRLALHAALALLAGAAVTVLVAWALALRGSSWSQGYTEDAAWPGPVPADWPETLQCMTRYTRAGGGLWQWQGWRNGEPPGDMRVFVTRSGWPFPALESSLHKRAASAWQPQWGPYDNENTLTGGLIVPLHWTLPQDAGSAGWCSRRLPLRPLAWGFLANTVLAAVPLTAVIAVWRSASTRAGSPRRRVLRLGGLR